MPTNSLDFSIDKWLAENGFHLNEIKLGLERLKSVGEKAELFSFPCPVITVAGTNGKGSTVAILATLLQAANLNVGTYTSPHLLQFNERIQINGKLAKDETIKAALFAINDLRGEIPLTYFEFTTLAGFYIFKQQSPKLDAIILEVGMGGRLDAVNAVSPNIAVITSIHYDHQQFLGDTLEEIAKEKAGIFRPNIPIVLGESVLPSIALQAEQAGNPVARQGHNFKYEDNQSQTWRYKDHKIALPHSKLPKHSLSIALAVYHILMENFLSLPDIGNITHVLANKAMIARMQRCYYKGVELILDAGHNAQASKWLADKLSSDSRSYRAIWASLSDKKCKDIVYPLVDKMSAWHVPNLNTERSARSEELLTILNEEGAKCATAHETVQEALDFALSERKPHESIIVFGSFYLVSEILSIININRSYLENNGLFTEESEK